MCTYIVLQQIFGDPSDGTSLYTGGANLCNKKVCTKVYYHLLTKYSYLSFREELYSMPSRVGGTDYCGFMDCTYPYLKDKKMNKIVLILYQGRRPFFKKGAKRL